MKKVVTIAVMLFTAIGFLIVTVSNAKTQEQSQEKPSDVCISIISYSCKPLGYTSGNRFVETKWDIKLKNNEGKNHSCNIKIIFYDKDKNELKEVTKEVNIKANQIKKYSNSVLLEPNMASEVTSTKAFIEDIH